MFHPARLPLALAFAIAAGGIAQAAEIHRASVPPAGGFPADPVQAAIEHRAAAELGLAIVSPTPLGATPAVQGCTDMLARGARAEREARDHHAAQGARSGLLDAFLERTWRDAARFCLMSAHLACRSAQDGVAGRWPNAERCGTVRRLQLRYAG